MSTGVSSFFSIHTALLPRQPNGCFYPQGGEGDVSALVVAEADVLRGKNLKEES